MSVALQWNWFDNKQQENRNKDASSTVPTSSWEASQCPPKSFFSLIMAILLHETDGHGVRDHDTRRRRHDQAAGKALNLLLKMPASSNQTPKMKSNPRRVTYILNENTL
jgi:hypothetical protein